MTRRHARGRAFPPLDVWGMPPSLWDMIRASWYCWWHGHDETSEDRCERCGRLFR